MLWGCESCLIRFTTKLRQRENFGRAVLPAPQSSAMATFGSLGGSVSPVLTAYIATKVGWTEALDFAALVTVVSGIARYFIDASRSIDTELQVPI